MAGDFNKPVVTDAYADVLASLRNIIADVAKGLDPALTLGTLNTPANAIRWNSANKYWEKFNGTSWAALETTYAISISGNAATATTAAACSGNAATATTAAACSGNAATATTAGALNAANSYTARNFIVTSAIGSAAGSIGYDSASRGLFIWGKAGGANDFQLLNAAGTVVANVPTGTADFSVAGTLSAGVLTSVGAISGTTITGSNTVRGNASTGLTTSSAVVGVASGAGTGLYGSSATSGYGVHGTTSTGDGVVGIQSGASGQGVRGNETGGGIGVDCQSSSTGVPFRIIPKGSAPTTSVSDGCFYTSSTGQPYVRISGVWRSINVT